MNQIKRLSTLFITCAIVSLLGCSQGEVPISPSDTLDTPEAIPSEISEQTNAYSSLGLMGMYNLTINPVDMSVELTTNRAGSIGESYIVSGMSFFTKTPCVDCLKLTGFSASANNIMVNFTIRHPFEPGDPFDPPSATNRLDLDVFDLAMLIEPLSQDPTNFPGMSVHAYSGIIANASGYTRELENVIGNQAALPFVLVRDDTIIGLPFYNIFPMGIEWDFSVNFSLEWDTSLSFNMYLTMGYGSSAKKWDRLDPVYYNPEFNRKAAWKVVVIPPQGGDPPTMMNTWSDNNAEDLFDVKVEVYDWQIGAHVDPNLVIRSDIYAPSEVELVSVDIPGLGFNSVPGTAHDGLGNGGVTSPLVYNIPIANKGLIDAGVYTGLVKVLDQRAAGPMPPTGTRDFLIHTPDGTELLNYEMPEDATYQTFEASVVVGVPGFILQQIDYELEDDVVLNSNYGSIKINYDGTPMMQYFNLNVDGRWAIRNIPLLSCDGFGVVQSEYLVFDLGTPSGTNVTSLNVGVSLGMAPLASPPAIMGSFTVADRYVRGSLGKEFTTFIVPLTILPLELNGGGSPAICVGPINWNLECGKNECVPAAVSNSLFWLHDTQGSPPASKWPGIPNMKKATNWKPTGCPANWDDPKNDYMNAGEPNDWDVETEGIPPDRPVNHQATEAECDQAMNAIANGDDVEIDGRHHVARVTGMVKTTRPDGRVAYSITVIHDTNQGNQGGCATETITYTPPQAGQPSETTGGSPGFFDGAFVNGFVAERPD